MTDVVFRHTPIAPDRVADWRSLASRVAGERAFLAICAAASAFGFSGSLAIHIAALTTSSGQPTLGLGVSTAAQAAGIVAGAAFTSRMSRMMGSRQIALLACAFVGTALVVLATPTSALLGAAVRLSLGFGLGLGVTVTEYILTARAVAGRRSMAISLYAVCFSGGAALGPASVYVLGTGLCPYALGAVAVCVAAASLYFADLRTRVERDKPSSVVEVMRQFPAAMASALFYGLLSSGVLDFMSVFATGRGLGIEDAALIAFAGLLGVLTLQMPIGFLGDFFTPSKLLPFCAILAVLVILALTCFATAFWVLCVAAFLLGGVCDAFYTLGLADMAERASKQQIAGANGCFVAFCGIGEIVGPLMASIVSDAAGSNALMLPFAAALALSLAVMQTRRGVKT